MKWVFFALLVLIGFGGGMLIVRVTPHWLSYDRVAAAVVFGLFCLALFAHWLASYSLEGARQDKLSEFAHSIFSLSIGAFCIWVGSDIVISDTCAYPLPRSGSSIMWVNQLADVTAYLQERGWCAALGYSFLLLGGAFSWPPLKLLSGAFIKKPQYPSL